MYVHADEDSFESLKEAGAIVLGISRDTVKAQKKFEEKYDLNYPLLADPDETVCNDLVCFMSSSSPQEKRSTRL